MKNLEKIAENFNSRQESSLEKLEVTEEETSENKKPKKNHTVQYSEPTMSLNKLRKENKKFLILKKIVVYC